MTHTVSTLLAEVQTHISMLQLGFPSDEKELHTKLLRADRFREERDVPSLSQELYEISQIVGRDTKRAKSVHHATKLLSLRPKLQLASVREAITGSFSELAAELAILQDTDSRFASNVGIFLAAERDVMALLAGEKEGGLPAVIEKIKLIDAELGVIMSQVDDSEVISVLTREWAVVKEHVGSESL